MVDVAVRVPTLLVFADDWGRHPSSCQHLIGHLLGRYEVYWVNTIGMRAPRFDLATLRRGLEKLRHWSRRNGAHVALPRHLQVINPWMWPWMGSRFSRGLNRELLHRQLKALIRAMPERPIAITTLPVVADLVGRLLVRRWVYYCVDDFSKWPGLDQTALELLERELVQKVQKVVAVSETLQERISGMGRTAPLLTHGVDLDHWSGNNRSREPPLALTGLERPLVLFWGVIDRRMDTECLRKLAADLSQGTIVLLGPEDNPDPILRALPRVVCLPPCSYDDLPAYAKEATVLVMPYADLPVNRAIQPLKLKEYLATGLPAVVRDLPATRPWADCLDLADTPDAFSRLVGERLTAGLPPEQQQARARLAGESWAEKARQFERWMGHDEES